MKYIVNITEPAERDLRAAVSYISEDLSNTTAALDLLELASKQFKSLKSMPDRHALVDDPVLRQFGVRQLIIDNYLGFYVIEDRRAAVHIIRFLYSGSDWIATLKHNLMVE